MLQPCAGTLDAPAAATAVSPDDLNRTVRLLDARAWQITATATGDRAARMVLDAYEHAVRSNPRPQHERRHRLEHAAFIDEIDLPRLGRLNVIASFQPMQAAPLQARIDAGPQRRREQSEARGHTRPSPPEPVRVRTGWPAALLNPMAAIHVVTDHRERIS